MSDSIFDHDHHVPAVALPSDIPAALLRKVSLNLPNPAELEVLRHYTRLSQKNFSIDTQFYPLGSCTMKYNPRIAHTMAALPGFARLHPDTPAQGMQGLLQVLWELQEWLAATTGMAAVSLTPAAGAQGELAGVAMIRAYHAAHGDHGRRKMLIPTAAHGTNPASAQMAGFDVVEIPNLADGDLDMAFLDQHLGPDIAGIMLTNPSTLGVFERRITEIAARVHGAGGLLYYDGANLNAILGRVRPGQMGFDAMHLNLHKTLPRLMAAAGRGRVRWRYRNACGLFCPCRWSHGKRRARCAGWMKGICPGALVGSALMAEISAYCCAPMLTCGAWGGRGWAGCRLMPRSMPIICSGSCSGWAIRRPSRSGGPVTSSS